MQIFLTTPKFRSFLLKKWTLCSKCFAQVQIALQLIKCQHFIMLYKYNVQKKSFCKWPCMWQNYHNYRYCGRDGDWPTALKMSKFISYALGNNSANFHQFPIKWSNGTGISFKILTESFGSCFFWIINKNTFIYKFIKANIF